MGRNSSGKATAFSAARRLAPWPLAVIVAALLGCGDAPSEPITAPGAALKSDSPAVAQVPSPTLMGAQLTAANDAPPQQVTVADAVVILDPPFAENPVETNHVVNATVTSAMGPVVGVVVEFEVSSPAGFRLFLSCTTDFTGRCPVTYVGPQEPDVHTIRGCIQGSTQCGEATKIWRAVASTPGSASGRGEIIHTAAFRVSFTFKAKFKKAKFHGSGVVDDQTRNTRVEILDVTEFVIADTKASIRGNALHNGVPTRYVMIVSDLGDPGAGSDTFTFRTQSGYEASGVLIAGDIEVRPEAF